MEAMANRRLGTKDQAMQGLQMFDNESDEPVGAQSSTEEVSDNQESEGSDHVSEASTEPDERSFSESDNENES